MSLIQYLSQDKTRSSLNDPTVTAANAYWADYGDGNGSLRLKRNIASSSGLVVADTTTFDNTNSGLPGNPTTVQNAIDAVVALALSNNADVTTLNASQAVQDALISNSATSADIAAIEAKYDPAVESIETPIVRNADNSWTMTLQLISDGSLRSVTTDPPVVAAAGAGQAAIDAAVLVETTRAEATESQLQTQIDGKADQADQLAQDNRLDALETDSHVALTLHADSIAEGATLTDQELKLPPSAAAETKDTTPTAASTVAVESGGVFDALALKEDKDNLVTAIREAATAEDDKYASELAIRTLVDGIATGQTVTPFGSTFATLPAIPSDASTTVRYRTILTADDIGTGTAAVPQYPKGEYHNVGASPAGWVFAAALGGNIIERTLAHFDDPVEKSIRGIFSPEDLDARFQNWTEITASGATLPGPGRYRINTDTITLPDHTLHIGKEIDLVNVTGAIAGGTSSIVNGSIAIPFRPGVVASGFSIVPQQKYTCIATATGWETPLSAGTTISLTQNDSGLVLTPGFIYAVTTTGAGMFLRLPEDVRNSIRVTLSNPSTHNLRLEQFDTTAVPSIRNSDGTTTATKILPVATHGLRHYFQGEIATGIWDATEPAVPVTMLPLNQSDPAVNYSDYVVDQGIKPRHLLQITNKSREFGRTIALDGKRLLAYKQGNHNPSVQASATSFHIPPNGVASISYTNEPPTDEFGDPIPNNIGVVDVVVQTSRDMGYFPTLALLTAINSNALLTGHFADVVDRRLHWDANATEGVAPDNIDITQPNPPSGRWVDSIADIPFWAPDTEHEVGDTVQQNRLPDGLLRQYSWDDSVNNAGVATDGTTGAVWNAAEQSRWIDLGSPEVGEVTSTILEYIELGFFSNGTNANSAASVTFIDLEGNNYPASDFEVSGTLTQHTGGTEEIVFDRTPFTGTINMGRNKSGRLRFYYVGSNPNGTDSIATGSSNNGSVTGLVAFKVAGSNETITFTSVGQVTPTPWTTLTERVADQIDSWEPMTAYVTGDRVVVPMPINADWIDDDGAVFGVNYIIEATADRPDTIAAFDDAEADSGNWKLISSFRISGNDFRTMSGSGTQAIALTDIRSNEVKQHTIPAGVTQSYFYAGNPAGISVFDDLIGTVTPTVVDSTTGVLSREFSVTGPARMTFTKTGNSPQFTFVSNKAARSIPRRTYDESGLISDEDQKAVFYNEDDILTMTVNSATDRQIVLIRNGNNNVVITDAGGNMFRHEDPNNPDQILPDETSITLNTNSTWTMDWDHDVERWVVSDGDTSGAPSDALQITPNRIWKQLITDLDNGSPQDFEFTTPGNSGDYRIRLSNRRSGNGNSFVQVFDDAARTNIIADGFNNRLQLDASGEGTTDLLIEDLAANTTYYLRFAGGGGSSNGEFIAAIYFDEGGTVSQVDLSQYTIDSGVSDGDYLILDVTNQRIIKGNPPASSTYSKVGDVHVEEGATLVRMWGSTAGVATITLPVEVADISECEIHITTEGTSARHIQPNMATSNGTTLGVVRIGGTGATFFWSVYGVKKV